jgi:multiple sugar transport system substrate-binding protein
MYGSNSYAEANVWLNLDPLITRDRVDLSRYFAPTIQTSTFRGTRYGLPVGMYTDALFYNKELFDNAALPPPPSDYSNAAWTWDKFVEYAQKMTKDTNGDGIPEQWGADYVGNEETIEASFGAHRYSDDFRQARFDSPEMVRTWQFLQDLQHRWKVQPTYQERVTHNIGGIGFATGKFGMLIEMTAQARIFTDPALPFDWALAAKPRGPAGPKTLLYLDTANIVSSSKNKDLAWEWIKFVSRPENLPSLSVFGYGAIPPTEDGALLYVRQAGKTLPNVDLTMFIKGAPYAFAVEYWRPQYQQTEQLVNAALGAIRDDGASVESTLKTLNEKVQALLDKYWSTRK